MVELVDTQDLKSCCHCGSEGSIPSPSTFKRDIKPRTEEPFKTEAHLRGR